MCSWNRHGLVFTKIIFAHVWEMFVRVNKMGWIYIAWTPACSLMLNKRCCRNGKWSLLSLTLSYHWAPLRSCSLQCLRRIKWRDALWRWDRKPFPPCFALCWSKILSKTWFDCVLPGDIDPQEMVPSRKNVVLVDGVILNGPTTDTKAGEKFVEDACRLIMEEVILKATDINEKVNVKACEKPWGWDC